MKNNIITILTFIIIAIFFLFLATEIDKNQNGDKKKSNIQVEQNNINLKNKLKAQKDSIALIEKLKYEQYLAGKDFETVTYGNQIWTKHNLNVSTFRNGDSIPEAKTNEEWAEAGRLKKAVWCYYQNFALYNSERYYGKLYNWWAVSDERGLAPEGFHVPNNDEWNILLKFLGNDRYDQWSTTAGEELISKNGFNAILGGFRYDFGSFSDVDEDNHLWRGGKWWTSDHGGCLEPPCENIFAYYVELKNDYRVTVPCNNPYTQNFGFSVRCIKGNIDTIQSRKQAELELQADFKVAELKHRQEILNQEREVKNQPKKVYSTDGTKCSYCGLGIYRGGVCSQCGTVSSERLNESISNRPNCEACNGTRYTKTYNGIRQCKTCNGTGKQTY